jgi:protein gp37
MLFSWLSNSQPLSSSLATGSSSTKYTTATSSSTRYAATTSSGSRVKKWPEDVEKKIVEVLIEYRVKNHRLPRSNELVDLFQSILPRKYIDKERIRSKIRSLKRNYENLRKKKDKLNATELNRYEVMSIIWPSANHGE